MILLLNHTLTQAQIEDAKNSLGVEKFVYMDDELKALWSRVPSDIVSIATYLQPVKDWALDACLRRNDNIKSDDYILIQGDFGATYHMINWAKQNGLKPIYATTKREAVEELQIDGTVKKTAIFEHERFREYE